MTDFASDFAAAFLSNPDETTSNDRDGRSERDDDLTTDLSADPAKKARRLRRGLVKAAGLQDMLLEK